MGPCTASSCCCQVQSVSWVPVRPSHCCCLHHRHTLPCATFRSPHTAGGFHFCHRVLGAVWPPIAAARARNLPWAPVPTPHAAARPVICHGPLYRLLMLLLPGPECVMGPCTASHCCCLHRHTLPMCHFQVSSHCWWVPFCHRVLYGLPLLLPGP
ncbi:unnamed protein product [Staurois parvus]|uniref:Uncharacterized protein n=1 Tax=Staurois parvus TaxID=386267 RepID=A0ABN9CGZ3_9NEOB|nr:unnamed protein product [Staurois parvus]